MTHGMHDDLFEDASERRQRPRRKPRRTGRKILFGFLILVLVLVATVGGYAWYLGRTFDKNSNTIPDEHVFGDKTPPPVDGKAMNILVLGADEPMDQVDFSNSRGLRSDTIMVAHVPEDRSSIQFMSIPRDSWVDIDGHGKAKINAALSYGGLPLAVSTVEDFIGAPINHAAMIDFEGFQLLTDSVGGVDVESSQAFSSGGHSFTEGTNHLDGEAALAFVRARKQFADGDLQRARNQQEFMSSLFGKIVDADTLSNPNKVTGMVRDFSPYMYLDSGLHSSAISRYALAMRDVRSDDIDFFTAPIAGAGRSSDGQSYVKVDEKELENVRKAFKDDTVKDYAENADQQHL
ncbi:transcriptional regulator [Brevibacterium luteolum]|uniref:Transcriptional regulator n=2 Tax=Brevibacterium luteolum TaxID=199591 RepID=A0A2N6PE61_9MICO|nr:transcriptional regulator [Brevibacterium luteolum]